MSRSLNAAAFAAALLAVAVRPADARAEAPGDGPPLVDSARYTFDEPADGWQNAGFDDSDWKEGPGGYGTRDTPGSRVGTRWDGTDLWLRKSYELKSVPRRPALRIYHDEDAEVYLNGEKVADFAGYVTRYKTVPLSQKAAGALKIGKNLLAVHCRQTSGGQFIDVHLVDAGAVPDLPPPPRPDRPFLTELTTEWGAGVTPENAWTEYPRPQMRRENWTNLNGTWDYAITPGDARSMPAGGDGEILVPYPVESKLSGVQRLLDPGEHLWYRRSFEPDPLAPGERLLLHFEAVDYRCEAFVNGKSVGTHTGGNLPFSFDVTAALNSGGDNELILRVEDATAEYQLRGKQVLNPRGIFYTQVSGIWGTVWTETVPALSIEGLAITTDADAGSITVGVETAGPTGAETSVRVTVRDGGKQVARETQSGSSDAVTLTIPDAKRWSPQSPHLYDLTVELFAGAGPAVDTVESYAGIRSVGKTRDADGHLRFTLNGERVFHLGPLDQGWWPDGLLTPPSDEAMIWELEWLKAAGFNMVRKHIKVEPRRYYYHCDRLGLLVWQDQVSGWPNPPWTRLEPNPTDADWPEDAHAQYMTELETMIAVLGNHPSIVVWVPFNEAWGQHRTVEVGEWTAERDPTRLVNVASGGNFWPVGDVADHHSYPDPAFPFQLGGAGRWDDFIKIVGEYGGHGLPVPGHLYDPDARNWGYGGLPKGREEYRERYVRSRDKLLDLKDRGVAAGVYTQTTDVEGEINGLMTYDRKVIKIPAADLADLHRPLTGAD